MFIDIRSAEKYLLGHVNGAININYYDLMLHPSNYLKKGVLYNIYCDTGYRSEIVVSKLKKLGYDCVNAGRYDNYL